MADDPEPERMISTTERVGRLAIGAAGAYVAGYLLAVFFWRGVGNPHIPAMASMIAFIALAAVLLIAERRSQP